MRVSEKEFEALVNEGIQAIPEKFLRLLKNVAVVIEDDLTPEKRREMGMADGEDLLGLYEGVPQTRRGSDYGGVLPDKITIFRRPILEEARTAEEVRAIVKDTVWHEIAHHFGMEEDQVEEAEARRKG